MLETRNVLLECLQREELVRLLSGARLTTLPFGETIFEPEQPTGHVYFPESGVISIITEAQNGQAAEGGMTGPESAAGLIECLASGVMASRGVVQVAGRAWVVKQGPCHELHESSPAFRRAVVRTAEFQLVEARQSLMCRSYHAVEQRLARWLLEMADRAGLGEAPLTITQDILALMLAVQRTTVSSTAHQLKARGLIVYARGRIQLVDRESLEHLACPCRQVIRDARARIFRRPA